MMQMHAMMERGGNMGGGNAGGMMGGGNAGGMMGGGNAGGMMGGGMMGNGQMSGPGRLMGPMMGVLDTDGDGQVSPEEMGAPAMMMRPAPNAESPAEQTQMMNGMNQNADEN